MLSAMSIRHLVAIAGISVSAAALAGTTPAITDSRPEPRRSGHIDKVIHAPSDMVPVPAGRFKMGPSNDELQDLLVACKVELGDADYLCTSDIYSNFRLLEREVYLDAFAIDRYEVSGKQYRECVAAGYCDLAALMAGDERYIRDEWPMVNVTWQDAADYCAWAGKRLPSEAEWEKAARGVDGQRWPWGNHVRHDGSNHGRGEVIAMLHTHALPTGQSFRVPVEYAPDDSDGHAYVAPVGAMRWSESPYGAYDMAGNVGEWVADFFSSTGYDGLAGVNPVRDIQPRGEPLFRVARGGSWAEPELFGRTYHRYFAAPAERSPLLGFRCAR